MYMPKIWAVYTYVCPFSLALFLQNVNFMHMLSMNIVSKYILFFFARKKDSLNAQFE